MDIYESNIDIGLGSGEQTMAKIRKFEKNNQDFFLINKDAQILDIEPDKGEMLSCFSVLGNTNLQDIDFPASVVHFVKKLEFQNFLANGLPSFLSGQKYSLITMCELLVHILKNQTVEFRTAVRNALTYDGKFIVEAPYMPSHSVFYVEVH